MRLARKFALALVAGILVVLSANAAYRVKREIELFETDSRRDGQLLGRMLAGAVERVWTQVGEAQALDLVEDTNERQSGVLIRWAWVSGHNGDVDSSGIPAELLPSLRVGEEVSVRRQEETDGSESLFSYVPVSLDGTVLGAIEVREPLVHDQLYIRKTIFQALITTGALVALCGGLALGLGMWFVGRPIRMLVGMARRVGQGDLSAKLELSQRDEIGELAEEMNAMCEQLAIANDRAVREGAARVAAVEQLRHADRLSAIGQIASGIAHELGTPLNVVSGRAQLIANQHPPDSPEHINAKIIVEQARRITVTIRELLDFARRRQPQKSPCKLRQIVDHTVRMLGSLADKHGVAITVEGDEQVVAHVDIGQIQQALTNLIMNGIQSMPKGGKVTVGLFRQRATPPWGRGGEADYLRIQVSDEGQGMPPEVLERVFEPFFTTKKIGEGTGLGLSLTRDIVEEHGGWIDAESEVGRGTCFFFYLPENGSK